MEELNFKTTSYRLGDYQVDLVVSKKNKQTVTDVWLGHYPDGAMKLYLFGLIDEPIGRVVEIVNNCITKDNTYTSGLDEADIYVK